eukprot:scaffold241_cov89-Cylindrotheca_fusiformis.AAC.2
MLLKDWYLVSRANRWFVRINLLHSLNAARGDNIEQHRHQLILLPKQPSQKPWNTGFPWTGIEQAIVKTALIVTKVYWAPPIDGGLKMTTRQNRAAKSQKHNGAEYIYAPVEILLSKIPMQTSCQTFPQQQPPPKQEGTQHQKKKVNT